MRAGDLLVMNIVGGAYCFHSQIIRRCLAGGAPQCFILLRSTGSTLEDLAELCARKNCRILPERPDVVQGQESQEPRERERKIERGRDAALTCRKSRSIEPINRLSRTVPEDNRDML